MIMHDIRLALGLIGFLSVGIFFAVRRIGKWIPPRGLDVSAVLLIGLMLAYLHFVWGQLWIVRWIPLPSVIILSNWFPLLLAALAAVVWVRMGGDAASAAEEEATTADMQRSVPVAARRTVLMVGMVIGGIWSVMYFIPQKPPECGNEWDPPIHPDIPWSVCRQTHPTTCSAASSATILTALGIPTTEQEMARLCLTRNGTTWLGLYHGLATKLLGTNYRAEFFESDLATVQEVAKRHPVLLCCQLDVKTAKRHPHLSSEDGWIPGLAHSVVYFGVFDGQHIIGDPSRGYEAWTASYLEELWTGQGLRIVDRRGGQAVTISAPPAVSSQSINSFALVPRHR